MGFLNFSREQVVFQEVPGEVSLAYTISGCPLRCSGCHSAATWPATAGQRLTESYLCQRLDDYHGLISCVLFLGGEWQAEVLLGLLHRVAERGIKRCLYTGLDDVSDDLKQQLTYLKTGPWIAQLGGLESPTTNQRFIDLRSRRCLNHKFHQ